MAGPHDRDLFESQKLDGDKLYTLSPNKTSRQDRALAGSSL